ncbi:hypothetical protein [Rahnella selenatireducens]|uniref:hypothetical protein n=1 Tax=Rahnella selenatireducens TaxID=3389797 RepID=UPI0039693393
MMIENSVSVSAQALLRAFLTRKINVWQSVYSPSKGSELNWRILSANLYHKILEPMWWCCRGPKPVANIEKDSLYWLCLLVQDPTPSAEALWISSTKFRYQKQTGSSLYPEIDKFLIVCFMDFVSINKMYDARGYENWSE